MRKFGFVIVDTRGFFYRGNYRWTDSLSDAMRFQSKKLAQAVQGADAKCPFPDMIGSKIESIFQCELTGKSTINQPKGEK